MRLCASGAMLLAVVAAGACTDRGSVTFEVKQPDLQVFNPVSSRLSEYELQTADGSLVAVATVSAGMGQAVFGLGPLAVTPAPEDMMMSLFSGSQLVGMARIRDVVVQKEQQKTYEANVRKPLVFVGAALPAESQPGNAIQSGEIWDFTSGVTDLENPPSPAPLTPKVPSGTEAAAVSSDGTLLLAGRANQLTIFDTGSGASLDMALPFTPIRVAVAARDTAAVAVDAGDAGGGGLAIFSAQDVAELHNGQVSPMVVKLPGITPRTAVFSADGQTIYVLSGGDVDPCAPGATPPAANTITLVGLDGTIKSTWGLPDFVSDLALSSSGALLLSRAVANQVAKLVATADTGPQTPQKLFDATCPTALRVTGNELLVVTSAQDMFDDSFTLIRAHDDGTASAPLTIPASAYVVTFDQSKPGDPQTSVTMFAKSLSAYDMAVTPDGQRALIAARIGYHQNGEQFTIIPGTDCTATLDGVEYGLYLVDTSSGNASYERRSFALTRPTGPMPVCMTCDVGFASLDITCPSEPGDRAAGLAAIFGGP